MNDWDRGNLEFILNCTDADLEDFYSWASDQDLVYALQLIQLAKAELAVEEIEILEAEADQDVSRSEEHTSELQSH